MPTPGLIASLAKIDDLEEPSLLRRAVASGDPIVARAHSSWFPLIREAAAVCGRLDDLMAVVAGGLRTDLPRAPVARFRFDPDRLGLGGHRNATRWRVGPGPSPVPFLEADDLAIPAPIVVLMNQRHGGGGDLATEIAQIHLARVASSTHVRLLNFPTHAYADRESGKETTENWTRPRHGPGRGRPASRDRTGGWEAAAARHASLPGAEASGGVLRLDRHGIRAFVHALPSPDAGENRVAVHAVCADGWIESAVAVLDAPAGTEADRVARSALADAVTRGDVGLASMANAVLPHTSYEYEEILESLRGGACAEALAGSVDVATFLAASSGHATGPDVMRAVAAGPGGGRARRDFVRTWPAVSSAILDPEVARAVDAGGRTVPLVAAALGLPPAAARRVAALPRMPDIGFRGLKVSLFAGPLGRILSGIPHDLLPRPGDRVEGEALCSCVEAAVRTLQHAECPQERLRPSDYARLLLGLPGRTWIARWSTINGTACEESGDMAYAFSQWLHALGHRDEDTGTALAMLTGRRGLAGLSDASRAWHATPRLVEWSAFVDEGATWPVPFAPVDLGDGWSAIALGSLEVLRAEGADGPDADGLDGLSHCVASYAVAALRGESIIVSLRRDAGAGPVRVSTAEIVPIGLGNTNDWWLAGRPYALAQHKAMRNAEPPAAAVEALARLRIAVAAPGAVDASALDPRELMGAESTRAQAEAVLPLWRRLMPRRIARMDADALLAEAEATHLAIVAAQG